MIQRPVSSNNLITHNSQLGKLTPYPREALLYAFAYNTDQITIGQLCGRNLVDDIALSINGNVYEGIDATTLDLSLTGINTGIVDGITYVAANARDYLIWGFGNNPNTEFQGFGITHKPYSAFTGPATANQGSTVTFTGLTNGYQFTEGARVVVRNTVGTAPLYEWNWGTIQTVGNTTCEIDLDNSANHGSNLTAATGGEILQWSDFKPWVVTSTTQTLFSPHYVLLGECFTETTGTIHSLYRRDEHFRVVDPISAGQFHTGNGTLANVAVSLGRIIPLWSNHIQMLGVHRTSSAGEVFQVKKTSNIEQYQCVTQVANQFVRQNGFVDLDKSASVTLDFGAGTITQNNIFINGYYTPGGMRL